MSDNYRQNAAESHNPMGGIGMG